MRKQGHKYIHFVDFQNKDVSLADPYCVGLLKQHNQQNKSCMFDMKDKEAPTTNSKGLSLLNRFSFADQTRKHQGNFGLFINGKLCGAESIDGQYLDHYNVDIFKRNFEYIWVKHHLTTRTSKSSTARARTT